MSGGRAAAAPPIRPRLSIMATASPAPSIEATDSLNDDKDATGSTNVTTVSVDPGKGHDNPAFDLDDDVEKKSNGSGSDDSTASCSGMRCRYSPLGRRISRKAP